jgi:ABC-type transporter Mla subunit MlaD
MTTISEAFTTLAAVQQRITDEDTTTSRDIARMVDDIEAARRHANEALETFKNAFNTVLDNLAGDLMALRDGRAKAIQETIGETAEVVPMLQAAE